MTIISTFIPNQKIMCALSTRHLKNLKQVGPAMAQLLDSFSLVFSSVALKATAFDMTMTKLDSYRTI